MGFIDMGQIRRFFILFFLLMWGHPIGATGEAVGDKAVFEELFNRWTHAFNVKNLTGSCSLFSKSAIAKYRGVAEKNYDAICGGFEKIFKEKDKKYQYSFELHNVYREGNLAVVRITWYLQESENGRYKSVTQDEGIDVLQRDDEGQWKIVNYLAFSE